ncbi:hypothetical protein D6764_01645 [Candidatus Woesearchaeota archaeon]|nr:MAG: hypothetical protein D6764_01645 [Candidatus Woesearchaeota archaeon]
MNKPFMVANKTFTVAVLLSLFMFSAGIFLEMPLSSLPARGEQINTSASVQNSPPVASSPVINGGNDITLTEGTTTEVLGTVTVTDDNGCTEIQTVDAVLYREGVGEIAGDDENNHYSATCVGNNDCINSSDLDQTFNCTFNMWYYADPTDVGSIYESEVWIFKVTPSDVDTGTPANTSVEVNTLTAIEISPLTIDYGALALGADTGAFNEVLTINNTGNEGVDVSVDGYGSVDGDGYAMVCTVGAIPLSYEQYSASPFAYGAGTALTDTAADVNLNIAQRTTTPTTADLYWGFGMPASGVSGSCSGVVNILAVSDPQLR